MIRQGRAYLVSLAGKFREYALRYPRRALSLAVIALFLAFAGVYWLSGWQLAEARKRIGQLGEEKKELLRKLAVVEVEAGTLRSSQLAMRHMIDQQEQQIADQERSLEFYRQLMVADSKKEGVDLSSRAIRALSQPGTYHCQFTFVQYAKKHLVFDGELSIRIEGDSPSGNAAYNFSDLITRSDGKFGKLNFKYFQTVEGQITLPDGFVPRQLIIDIKSKTIKPGAWQHKLGWYLEES